LWLGWQSLVRFDVQAVLGLIWRTGLALAGMAAVIWWVTQRQESWGTLWTAGAASALGGLVYVAIVGVLNYREARALVQTLGARIMTNEARG
jgi:hypothetical protein